MAITKAKLRDKSDAELLNEYNDYRSNNDNNSAAVIIQEIQRRKSVAKQIADYEANLNAENNAKDFKEKFDNENKLLKLLHEQKLKNIDAEAYAEYEAGKSTASKIVSTFSSKLASTLTSAIENGVESYVSSLEALNEHLIGTNSDYKSVTDTLQQALSTNTLVKQESVYTNLQELVKQGIVSNVEQKAFLQSLSDDMSMVVKANNESLNRLFRLQSQDTLANRLSLEYTLQSFLNTNYENSQYIRDAMVNVTSALVSSEALMSANSALNYEASVQSWLGSFYSSGMSSTAVNSIATAINALSSGDISNIDSGISKLLMMGAAQSGMDYGSLLTGNLSSSDVNQLMSGVTSYLQEIINTNSDNNVVLSQLSSLFGLSDVSDLISLSNLEATVGSISTTSTGFLDQVASLVPAQSKASNFISNLLYTLVTETGYDAASYYIFEATKLLQNSGIGDILTGLSDSDSFLGLGGSALNTIGVLINNAELIGVIPALLSTITDVVKGATSSNSATSLYNALGSANNLGTTIKVSTSGTSDSLAIANGSTDSLVSGLNLSLNDSLGGYNITADDSEQAVDLIQEDVSNIYATIQQLYDNSVDILSELRGLPDVISQLGGA